MIPESNVPAIGGIVPGEQVLYRDARALIGWMSDQEAAGALLGHAPTPTDDQTSIRRIHDVSRAAVTARPPFKEDDPTLAAEFPGLKEVAERSEVAANFANMNWRPALVDLSKVLSFQKIIHVDGITERLEGIDDDGALLEVCIPAKQPAPPTGAFTDPDGKGFTISSYNPNLRIAGGHLAEANVSQSPGLPEVKMQAVTLFVFLGTSYLQVVRYRGRCFVRDGYHRAAGLLRKGITKVPCIFIEARSFEEVGATQGAFTFETLYGDRPPRLSDFWLDDVSRDVRQIAVRKVVRVRGEEFVVQR